MFSAPTMTACIVPSAAASSTAVARASALKPDARIAAIVTHPQVMDDPESQRSMESLDEALAAT